MKNASVWITIGIFIISTASGVIFSYGRLNAQSQQADDRLNKAENKIEVLKSENDKVQTKQEAIAEQVDKIDEKMDKVLDVVISLKQARPR